MSHLRRRVFHGEAVLWIVQDALLQCCTSLGLHTSQGCSLTTFVSQECQAKGAPSSSHPSGYA